MSNKRTKDPAILVTLRSNEDILLCIKLYQSGYTFRISCVEYAHMQLGALSGGEQDKWQRISNQAWNNQGVVNDTRRD